MYGMPLDKDHTIPSAQEHLSVSKETVHNTHKTIHIQGNYITHTTTIRIQGNYITHTKLSVSKETT